MTSLKNFLSPFVATSCRFSIIITEDDFTSPKSFGDVKSKVSNPLPFQWDEMTTEEANGETPWFSVNLTSWHIENDNPDFLFSVVLDFGTNGKVEILVFNA